MAASRSLWDVLLRWAADRSVPVLFFALVYALAPDRRQRSWRWVTPGYRSSPGLLWLALSGLLPSIATFAGPYSKTYGTIASGVILLLWLNYSAFALLFGAELNAELDRQADIHAAGEWAGLIKPARRGR